MVLRGKEEEENKPHLFLYVTYCPNYHFTNSANQVFLDESDTDAMTKFVDTMVLLSIYM